MQTTPQFNSAHWVRKLHMVSLPEKLKIFGFTKVEKIIQNKIISFIFSVFLNEFQVHIYRQPDTFHKPTNRRRLFL